MKLFKKVYYYVTFTRPFAFLGIFITSILASIIAISSSKVIEYSILKIFIGALSSGFIASASFTINNIYDLEIDKINKPFRALPSKKITIKEAWIITILLYLLSLMFAASINLPFFIIISMMGTLAITYSHPLFNFKKNWFLASLTLATFRGFLITVAGWSIIKSIASILPWYLGLISFSFLLGAVTTKDIADIKGDRKNKYQTLPVKYGLNKTINIIAPFFILPFLLIPLGVYLGILDINTMPLTLLLFYGIYIIWLIKKMPLKLTGIQKNHISWKHTYILYMILQIGMAIAYIV